MKWLLKKQLFANVVLFLTLIFLSGCMRFLTDDRSKVLMNGIDMDQTLNVAKVKMENSRGKMGTSLPIWVIRDQNITPDQGKEISRLYFQYVDSLQKKFDLWHLTWAVSNIYKLGNDSLKEVMHDAYKDAAKRAREQKGIADRMVNGDKIFMGDAHSGGRAFAKKHIVIPGNKKYLQSFEQYRN